MNLYKKKIRTNMLLHGDQINMFLFSGTLYKVTCPVYATVHVCTGQVTFFKVPETHGQF